MFKLMGGWVRGLVLAAAFGALAGAAQAQQGDSFQRPDSPFVQAAIPALELSAKDCKAAYPALVRLTKRSDFPRKDGEFAVTVYGAAAGCAMEQEKYDEASGWLDLAVGYEEAPADLHLMRLVAAMQRENQPTALAVLQDAIAAHPRFLAQLTLDDIGNLWGGMKPGTDLEMQFLELISSGGWTGDNPTETIDFVLIGYADRLMTRGEEDRARKVVQNFTAPWIVQAVRFHPKLKQFMATDPAATNVRAAAERLAASLVVRGYRQPDRLDVLVVRADLIRSLGRPKEALALLDAQRARVDKAPRAGGFSDAEAFRPRWWATRGWILFDLGRHDEALTSLRYAAALPAAGRDRNAEFIMDLAAGLVRLGRGDEALAAIAPLQGWSGLTLSEQMRFHRLNVCARDVKGDAAGARAAAEAVKLERGYERSEWDRLQMCAGNPEAVAAANLKDMQVDDLAVASILLSLAPEPERPFATARDKLVAGRWAALLARPDLKAAIDKAGGIEVYPLIP